jgi:hypothetical protein
LSPAAGPAIFPAPDRAARYRRSMSDQPENPTLVYLRRLDQKLDRLLEQAADLAQRVTSPQTKAASLRGDFANRSLRIDRIEVRLDRIERRLDLLPAV